MGEASVPISLTSAAITRPASLTRRLRQKARYSQQSVTLMRNVKYYKSMSLMVTNRQ